MNKCQLNQKKVLNTQCSLQDTTIEVSFNLPFWDNFFKSHFFEKHLQNLVELLHFGL